MLISLYRTAVFRREAPPNRRDLQRTCRVRWSPRGRFLTVYIELILLNGTDRRINDKAVVRELNRLAALPVELFEGIMRYLLGVFTPRLSLLISIIS